MRLTSTKGIEMSESKNEFSTVEETVDSLRSAQSTRRRLLKDLRRDDNTAREQKTLIKTLELVHKTIMLASLNLDLERLQNYLDVSK